MAAQPIILDCDPGRDDALAIALALASPEEIAPLGITTVAGNVPLELTQRNARFLCELCGHDEVPVYAGASRPLKRAPVSAEEIHGRSGLEGLEVSEPAMPLQDRHAVDFIVESLGSCGEDGLTLVACGPLTNLAMVVADFPKALAKVRQIVLMGGASRVGGNVTPAAEFNIHADPEAAAAVFACGRPITTISLDATYQVLAGPDHAERLERLGGTAARCLAKLLRPVAGGSEARFGSGRIPLHDPCTVAWLLRPHLFETQSVAVAVETEGAHTLGTTVVDWWGVTGRPPNAKWVTRADGNGVLDLLIERIARL
ncbi:MAG: nucleoside hydrolase [Kiloniellales bacterium]|nr:nucleoside hydrolase [Kiloniellales bacterium]